MQGKCSITEPHSQPFIILTLKSQIIDVIDVARHSEIIENAKIKSESHEIRSENHVWVNYPEKYLTC